MKLATLTIAIAVAAAGVTPAAAATYALHYAATRGRILPTVADFRITTANVVNAIGGFDILSVSGSVNGIAITGLAPINPPGFLTDNVFFATAPNVNMYGLGWTSGTGTGNLFYLDDEYQLGQFDPTITVGPRRFNQTSGTLTLAAVPEPASWAMLLIGFAAVGTAARRARPGVAAFAV